jgi:hypothetical protein
MQGKPLTDEFTHTVKYDHGLPAIENRLNFNDARTLLLKILTQKVPAGEYIDYLVRVRGEDNTQIFKANLDTIKLTPMDNIG